MSVPVAPALGVECFMGDVDSASEAVVGRAMSGEGGYACLSNVHALVSAVHDPALRRAVNDAWVVFPDGSPIAWLQRRAGAGDATRIAGPDLMARVFEIGQASGLRHYLYGSSAPVLESLTARLGASSAGGTICGSCAPPFAAFDSPEHSGTIEEIKAAEPHIVWCSLGMPKQELWMRLYAPSLAPALVLGVGAAFDFIAGTKRRAPKPMQRLGLEWLYRLGTEPNRLAARYLQTNSEFVALLAWELLNQRRRT
jgi:N-acetylglucosaminyldiphosphoundecaprenol N-acetyl-beta-D-mannosaminyltransferase